MFMYLHKIRILVSAKHHQVLLILVSNFQLEVISLEDQVPADA
jgi:hypothetical protein